jgi:hypothetical protein
MLKLQRPVAITMWDFSWIERRWPGAGYEDWDRALDDLAERGYNAVRIDAFPHLVHWGSDKLWEIVPTWHFLDWGAAMTCDIRVMPALIEFIAACHRRQIKVGLSTWFREDRDNVRMRISSPDLHGQIWITTLNAIKQAGLLDAILYVDLCNEWPIDRWAPFFKEPSPENGNSQASRQWMSSAIDTVRREFPQLPLTISFWPDVRTESPRDFSFVDFFEPHLWMAVQRDFYKHVDYTFPAFDIKGMENVARNARSVYEANPKHWQDALIDVIDAHARYSRKTGRGLITTECWAVVDYKDGPRFDWGWVKELCALGTERAASTGRWLGIATSNFCGPQFPGMWRDVAWHQRLTSLIKSAAVDRDLQP